MTTVYVRITEDDLLPVAINVLAKQVTASMHDDTSESAPLSLVGIEHILIGARQGRYRLTTTDGISDDVDDIEIYTTARGVLYGDDNVGADGRMVVTYWHRIDGAFVLSGTSDHPPRSRRASTRSRSTGWRST